MYTILNQNGEPVAYIQNMMIMDLNQEHVHGILIGDCFFGKKKPTYFYVGFSIFNLKKFYPPIVAIN